MTSIKVSIITILLTIIYLLLSVSVSNLAFNYQSNGSLIKENGTILGSKLIGQEFSNNSYFHNRPSSNNYQNNISGSSNLPYYSEELQSLTKERYEDFTSENRTKLLDLNLISESASGLDPHITYKSALSQIERISSTGLTTKDEIINLIEKTSRPQICGLFGNKIVNVLELNLKLRDLYATKSRTR